MNKSTIVSRLSSFATAAAVAAFAANAAADPSVGQILVHQLWPWSQNIKVEYTLSGTGGATYDMNVTASEAGVAIPADKLSSALCGGEGFWGITGDGIHSFTLDPSKLVADGATALSDFTVSIAPGGLGDPQASRIEYRVFDLETGEVTDLRRRDIYARPDLYGTPITDFSLVGAGIASIPQGDVFIAPGFTNDVWKTTKLVMKRIPAANVEFWFGPSTDDTNTTATTKYPRLAETRFKAKLTSDFWMGVHEVTQKQYEMLIGTRPAFFSHPDYWETRPLENVCRDEFLHSTTGFIAVATARFGKTFDLPTEAQWEFAAKAGYDGPDFPGGLANDNATFTTLEGISVPRGGWSVTKHPEPNPEIGLNSGHGTYPCGIGKPNAYGLYNLYGNVTEWCKDKSHKDLASYYSSQIESGVVTNPYCTTSNNGFGYTGYIYKGGPYNASATVRRPAYRGAEKPTNYTYANQHVYFGWRVVCPAD